MRNLSGDSQIQPFKKPTAPARSEIVIKFLALGLDEC